MSDHLAVYGGTFDPVHRGHLDLVERAAGLFRRVAVLVAAEGRATLFPVAERVALLREATAHLENVAVEPFTGLLVKRAEALGARVLLRGIRSARDWDVELPMAFANQGLAPSLETVFLAPSAATALVSASLVREVSSLGGDVSAWVPPAVVRALGRLRTRTEPGS
jgi:pantetheine-phosphate adenylyltransferase